MNKEMSVYLDATRFLAAILVVITHASGKHITGGFLWQLSSYGSTAVMVFFVLSGYVIAYVTHTRETHLTSFVNARLSRMYSVVIPALIVTFVCNEFGDIYRSESYLGTWNTGEEGYYIRYLVSLLMLQEVWFLDLSPSNNGSFWSMSYEFFYYAIAAAAIYFRGAKRVLLITLAIAVAGPSITVYLPIWLFGYMAYLFHSTYRAILPQWNPWGCVAIFVSTLLLLAISPYHRSVLGWDLVWISRDSLPSDYIDGIIFTVHIVVAPVVTKMIAPILLRYSKEIVYLASYTFTLYLFHLPILRFVAAVSPFVEEPSSFAHISLVYGVTLGFVFLVGGRIERSKQAYKALFGGWLSRSCDFMKRA